METLTAAEARVLGCLIEKEITTPEYYPLTLNALVNACNQKSNRDPVVSYKDDDVEDALAGLREKRLSFVQTTGSGSRVPKYGHRAVETLNLGRRELPLICELLLRGPQTVGELRTRADRMHRFSDLDEVETCLRGLMEREPDSLVTRLDRLPGTKEPRFAQLLTGEPAASIVAHEEAAAAGTRSDRIGALESEVQTLKDRIDRLESELSRFRQQFE